MNSLQPSDFTIKAFLGKGSFGEVYLAVKNDTQQEFAMKILSKSEIMRKNMVRYAMTERNVLKNSTHPFIVELHFAFQTEDKLYMILQYAPGGDLSAVLQKEKRLNERQT